MSKLRLGVVAWLSALFSAAICLAAMYITINLHGDYGFIAFCGVPVALGVICCGFMRIEGPKTVVQLGGLPEPHDWFLRSGLACPVSTELQGSGVGATRLCLLSTGPMPERITTWQPGRRLGFTALSTPPPLKELNPFYDIKPPHQHGYYEVLYGEFRIEQLPNGRSRLTRITKYINRIRPSFYWNWWCNLAADHAHRYVIESVRNNVEGNGYNAPNITR